LIRPLFFSIVPFCHSKDQQKCPNRTAVITHMGRGITSGLLHRPRIWTSSKKQHKLGGIELQYLDCFQYLVKIWIGYLYIQVPPLVKTLILQVELQL